MSVWNTLKATILPKVLTQARSFLCPIHREGWVIVVLFACVTLLLFHLVTFLGWLGVVFTIWSLYFFRDPERVIPQVKDTIISPADGVLLPIVHVIPPAELGLGDTKHTRLSIFMNVFNVHVNRIPIAGVLRHVSYHPGAFHNAALDKASEQNEHKNYVIQTDAGHAVAFVQVAGLLARRIKSGGLEGERVEAGERIGIIRFGSRVDVYLPLSASIRVSEGMITVAGETILADFSDRPSVAAVVI